jgi:hypothetical protein
MRPSFGVFLLVSATVLLLHGVAVAVPFTDAEKSLDIAMEAAVLAAADLVQLFGPLPAILPFEATFGNTGWSMTMDGFYGGIPLSLSFTGVFDPSTATGTHTSVGTFGAEVWSSSGAWAFADIDESTISLSGGTDTELGPIAGPKKTRDKILNNDKVYRKDDDGRQRLVSGTYCRSINGAPDPPDCPPNGARSQVRPPDEKAPGGRNSFRTVLELPDDSIQLTGEFDLDLGTFSGRIAVPEPLSAATAFLLGSGAVFLARLAHRGRRPQHGDGEA